MTPTVRLDSREDVLAFTPYQLGYHPSDSIVLLGLKRRSLGFVARCEASAPPREIIRSFCLALKRGRGTRRAVLLAYGPESLSDPARQVADGVEARGFPVLDALRVEAGRYFCLRCDRCTPVSGAPFDITINAAAASATFAGMVARPDRESVERLVMPAGALGAVEMAQAVDRAVARLASLGGHAERLQAGKLAVDEALALARSGERLDADAAAWLSVLIDNDEVRDHAWARTDAHDWQLGLWLDLTRRAEPVLAAPFATLLGWCAWRRGDGVLALAALSRANRIDPAYELASVLLGALDEAQPPTTIKQWPPPD
jgi:hypothetical protein